MCSRVSRYSVARLDELPRIPSLKAKRGLGGEGAKELGGRCGILQAELAACRAQVFALETELQRSRSEHAIAAESFNSRLTEAAQALRTSHAEFMKMVGVVKRAKGRLRAMKQQLSTYDDVLNGLSQVSRELTEEKEKSSSLEGKLSSLETQLSEMREAHRLLDSALYEKGTQLEAVESARDEHWRRLQRVAEDHQVVVSGMRALEDRLSLTQARGYQRHVELASALNNIILSAVLNGSQNGESAVKIDRNTVHLNGQQFRFDQIINVTENSSQTSDSLSTEMDILVQTAFEGQKVLIMNYGYVRIARI